MTVRPLKPNDRLPEFVLVAGRSAAQEAAAMREGLEEFSTAPQPGCPQLSDWAAWPQADDPQSQSRRDLLAMTHRQAHLILVNAFDAVTSLGRLLGGDGAMPVFSHMTESRVACEAAVRFAWMIDPVVTSEERVMRGAVGLLVSAEEQLKGLRRVPAGRFPREVLQRMIDNCSLESHRVEQLIAAAGIRPARSRDQQKIARLELDSPRVSVPVKLDVTEKMAELLPDVPSFYNIGSGVVHSHYWMLRDVVADKGASPELAVEPDLMQIGAATVASIHASKLIIDRCARYYGHDASAHLSRSAQRLEAVDQRMRVLGMIKAAGWPAHQAS